MLFNGLGVQKDTQTPCWLRPCPDALLAKTINLSNTLSVCLFLVQALVGEPDAVEDMIPGPLKEAMMASPPPMPMPQQPQPGQGDVEVDGMPLEGSDEADMDGASLDGEVLKDDVDGNPLEEDVDGMPLSDDLDGRPSKYRIPL